MSSSSLRLATGATIPTLGFGTWQIPDGAPAYDATAAALRAGYRHVDSARAYGNEASVGRAVRDSGLSRGEVFVTSKLPAEIKDHRQVQASFDQTMRQLTLDYVDLYLIHAPWPWSEIGKDCTAQNKQVWAQMEAIHATGRARAIGTAKECSTPCGRVAVGDQHRRAGSFCAASQKRQQQNRCARCRHDDAVGA